MRLSWATWRLWDQSGAIANARSASTELTRSRAEREEAERYVARHLASTTTGPEVLLSASPR